MFNQNYREACTDLETARVYMEKCSNLDVVVAVDFQTAFCLSVVYDHLDLNEKKEEAVQHLLSNYDQCDCIENSNERDDKVICKGDPVSLSLENDNYSDILGPDEVSPGWCFETVKGTAKAMHDIAACSKTQKQRDRLNYIVERLTNKAIRCCRAGGMWKRCVAPLARKWRAWNDFKNRFGYPPLPPANE